MPDDFIKYYDGYDTRTPENLKKYQLATIDKVLRKFGSKRDILKSAIKDTFGGGKKFWAVVGKKFFSIANDRFYYFPEYRWAAKIVDQDTPSSAVHGYLCLKRATLDLTGKIRKSRDKGKTRLCRSEPNLSTRHRWNKECIWTTYHRGKPAGMEELNRRIKPISHRRTFSQIINQQLASQASKIMVQCFPCQLAWLDLIRASPHQVSWGQRYGLSTAWTMAPIADTVRRRRVRLYEKGDHVWNEPRSEANPICYRNKSNVD